MGVLSLMIFACMGIFIIFYDKLYDKYLYIFSYGRGEVVTVFSCAGTGNR